MKKPILLVLVLLLAVLVFNGTNWAADEDSYTWLSEEGKKLQWLDFGMGLTIINTWNRSSINVQYSKQKDHTIYSFRWLSAFRLFSDAPSDRVSELGLLYGKAYSIWNKRLCFSASTGLALTRTKEGRELRTTIGVPLEARFSFNIFPFAGIGCSLFMNVNPIKTFQGFMINIRVGRLY